MSNIQGTVRAFARDTQSPAEMCKRVNRSLCDNIGSHKFATFFYGVLDTAQNRLTYANAGHIPPIVMRSDGSHEQLTEGGLVLGIVDNAVYKEASVDVAKGDRVVLVTDGITEATDSNGEEFGIDRLVALLERSIGKPELHRDILSAVSEFANQEFQDDATILVAELGQPRKIKN
jgi:sigma-B regulation protein RsbU (phosphoserine phosphatase)